MFNKYLISKLNNKDVIYLYLNNRYEISNDLYLVKKNDLIVNNVRNYLKNMDVNYKNKDIYLVINDIIVAKLNSKILSRNLNYLEYIRYGKKGIEDFLDIYPSLKLVDVERSNGIIEEMKLNNYLLNVIVEEFPNVLEIEALKAEAVLARSYVIKRKLNNKKIREFNDVQLYRNKMELKKELIGNYNNYIKLVKNAIINTSDEIIKYKDDIIECFSHYRNCGKTEDSKEVLGVSYPYLVSVISPEIADNDLLRYRKVSNKHLSKLLGMNINKDTKVSILKRTNGNNVRYIKFDNKVFDGFTIAKRLSLISYDYFINISDEFTWFVVRGCGINLGISKYGSIKLAKKGLNYKEILKYYFPNTYIDKIN